MISPAHDKIDSRSNPCSAVQLTRLDYELWTPKTYGDLGGVKDALNHSITLSRPGFDLLRQHDRVRCLFDQPSGCFMHRHTAVLTRYVNSDDQPPCPQPIHFADKGYKILIACEKNQYIEPFMDCQVIRRFLRRVPVQPPMPALPFRPFSRWQLVPLARCDGPVSRTCRFPGGVRAGRSKNIGPRRAGPPDLARKCDSIGDEEEIEELSPLRISSPSAR